MHNANFPKPTPETGEGKHSSKLTFLATNRTFKQECFTFSGCLKSGIPFPPTAVTIPNTIDRIVMMRITTITTEGYRTMKVEYLKPKAAGEMKRTFVQDFPQYWGNGYTVNS